MENITLGQISSIIAFLVAFIGGMATLLNYIKKWLKVSLKDELEPIKDEITFIRSKQQEEAMVLRRNELMRCFHIIKNGGKLDSDEIRHYHKTYDEYIANGGNSYVKELNDKYVKEGKL